MAKPKVGSLIFSCIVFLLIFIFFAKVAIVLAVIAALVLAVQVMKFF
jgi:hypothetical protein